MHRLKVCSVNQLRSWTRRECELMFLFSHNNYKTINSICQVSWRRWESNPRPRRIHKIVSLGDRPLWWSTILILFIFLNSHQLYRVLNSNTVIGCVSYSVALTSVIYLTEISRADEPYAASAKVLSILSLSCLALIVLHSTRRSHYAPVFSKSIFFTILI